VGGGRPKRWGAWARALADVATLVRLSLAYWLAIQPQVRRELARWDRRARAIPDPVLRAQALAKLDAERLNPEAAALFAVLAPLRRRSRMVRLIVAYQVLYDYLDGVNEQPGYCELRVGLRLHQALSEALMPDGPLSDYYAETPGADDGGYLRELCEACRSVVAGLSRTACFEQTLRSATERCGEAQSHNHAARGRRASLVHWSSMQAEAHPGYEWWELVAGGISCLNIHALLACMAVPGATAEHLARVDRAYFPSVCSISALLDSLSDYASDLESGNHSFVAHYRDAPAAARRLRAIAGEAASRTAALDAAARHQVILAGILAYYLSCPSVSDGFPAEAAQDLIACGGWLGPAMLAVLRARRRAQRAPSPQPVSRSASPGCTREAAAPGSASSSSVAPTIAPTAISTSEAEIEKRVGKPVADRR
jgi:tetraprenyl-beta-curcumene synthase